MKLRFVLTVGAALAALAGCSGNDGRIEVASEGAALTESGGDRLFSLKIVEAREGGYARDGLRVKITPDGADAVDVVFTVNDADGDGALGVGDTLACSEPAENVLGPDASGKEVDVELFASIDGEEERVGSATWTPSK